jgi:hypothetical protein
MRLAHQYEDFATVAYRLNLVPRIITVQEWIADGEDRIEILQLLLDLEREIVRAAKENELEEAA